jgi:lysophospholipase L1-like esterase
VTTLGTQRHQVSATKGDTDVICPEEHPVVVPARPTRRVMLSLTAVFALLFGVLIATPASAAPPVPNSMASLGDSITRGFNACGWFSDCPSSSWTTGDNAEVNSHFTRLQAQNSELTAHNDGKTGAVMADMQGQAESAVSQQVDYVTVLLGANDACASSEEEMTSVADFESRFRAGMDTLRSGLPDALIFVSSVPDIKRLWEVGKDNSSARSIWDVGNICQSMLANPTSTEPADEERRDRVRQRVIEYNAVLAQVCGESSNCKYDGDAVFSFPFELSHVSGWDYFHPNKAGQNILAEHTYQASFWGTGAKSRKDRAA